MHLRAQLFTKLITTAIAFSYLVQLTFPGYKEALWISGFDYQQGQYWRLITVALVHNNFIHVSLNLYALYVLGASVELYLGRKEYIFILLTSLIFGSLASALFNNPSIKSVGASGIVFGLFGSLILIGARARVSRFGIIGLVITNFALSFFVEGIDWRAHIGGLLGGLIITFVATRNN